jgi:hypothetical protein
MIGRSFRTEYATAVKNANRQTDTPRLTAASTPGCGEKATDLWCYSTERWHAFVRVLQGGSTLPPKHGGDDPVRFQSIPESNPGRLLVEGNRPS